MRDTEDIAKAYLFCVYEGVSRQNKGEKTKPNYRQKCSINGEPSRMKETGRQSGAKAFASFFCDEAAP